MKAKLLPFIVSAIITIVSCNLKPEDFQYKDAQDFQEFLAPIDFSSDQSFSDFLQRSYNQPCYAQDFLPNNFDHLIQFLEHGISSHRPRIYEQHVVRLFANKLKSCGYINAAALSHLLGKMPVLLEPYFVIPKRFELHVLQEQIHSLLYARFAEKFSLFKSSPASSFDDLFGNVSFNELSGEILNTLSNPQDEYDVSMDELRKTVLLFLETALSKLIWSPEDGIETWRSVKTISEQLALLVNYNVILDLEDLNGLYITLIERYCFFVDVAGSHLPEKFYQEIKEDIAHNKMLLLSLDEQDECLQTKRDRLASTVTRMHKQVSDIRIKELFENAVRPAAYEHGLVVS